MSQRFLAFLLYGILAFTSFAGLGRVAAPASTDLGNSSEVGAMDGGNPYPPPDN